MPDINLTCVECKNPFYFTERDQAFYQERGFQQPKRCFHCRQKRKQNSVNGGGTPPSREDTDAGFRRSRRRDHYDND